jgi:chromosome partitioning protein
MPVIALLNQKGGVGKTTLAIHIATALSATGRVLLVDADPQASALDWSSKRSAPSLFTVVGFPKPFLHREIASLSHGYDWTIIDGAPRVNELARSAIASADAVIIPVQPSPFDVWGAKDILDIIAECVVHQPVLQTRFAINRIFPNTTLAGEVKEALSEFDVPVMKTSIRNRTEYAKAARNGLTAIETDPDGPAAQEIGALVAEIRSLFAESQEKAHA